MGRYGVRTGAVPSRAMAGSKQKSREAIELILEGLGTDGLRRLCDVQEIALGRSDSDRRERLARSYRARIRELIDDLRRNDLVDTLGNVEFETDAGVEYALGRLRKANVDQLRAAAVAVFIDDWEPSGDGSGPPRSGPIDSYVTDDSDEELGEEDQVDDESNDSDFSFAIPGLVDAWRASDRGVEGLLTDLEDEGEGAERLLSYERIDPAASSPEGRHDATLVDFQSQAVCELDRHFARPGARGLLCLPTGGGKTRTSLDWLLSRFVARGQRVLWVTHRVDLLDQAHEEIRGLGWLLRTTRPQGFTVSRYQGRHDDLSGDVVLASAATLASRMPTRQALSRGAPLGVVVYDEAHRAIAKGTWAAISRLIGRSEVPFLGLTATPFRTERGGTDRLLEELGGPVYQRTFKDLIDNGFLARPIFVRQQLRSTHGFVISGREQDEIRRRQDLTPGVLGRLAREPKRNREIVDHWYASRAQFGKTLAFACNLEHADNLAKLFAQQPSVRATSLHSDLPPQERTKRLRAFRDGELDVLVNVGILTEGANVPDTRTVLMARPTMSTSLYLQMIGRGARGPRAVPGKTQFYVIDCVDNFGHHGLELAGREVAARLEVDSASAPVTRAARKRGPADERRERREVALAAAWLASRGYDPRAYTFWGELRWEGPTGPASVAVFTETIAAVEEAVRLAQAAVASGQWQLARDRGPHLENVGALRAVDWARAITDAQRTRIAPQLLPIADLTLTSADLGVANQLQALAVQLRTVGFDAAMLAADRAWQSTPELQARFASTAELRQDITNLASSQVQPSSAPSVTTSAVATQSQAVPAFVELGLAIARADQVVDQSERLAILRGAERLFGADVGTATSVDGALRVKESQPTVDPTHACAVLRGCLDWPSRLVTFDLLFRVALADGRLAEEERTLLEACAAGLEVPRDELTERLRWYQSTQPRVVVAAAGYRTCPSCSATFEGTPNFCGFCGTLMSATR